MHRYTDTDTIGAVYIVGREKGLVNHLFFVQ